MGDNEDNVNLINEQPHTKHKLGLHGSTKKSKILLVTLGGTQIVRGYLCSIFSFVLGD